MSAALVDLVAETVADPEVPDVVWSRLAVVIRTGPGWVREDAFAYTSDGAVTHFVTSADGEVADLLWQECRDTDAAVAVLVIDRDGDDYDGDLNLIAVEDFDPFDIDFDHHDELAALVADLTGLRY